MKNNNNVRIKYKNTKTIKPTVHYKHIIKKIKEFIKSKRDYNLINIHINFYFWVLNSKTILALEG